MLANPSVESTPTVVSVRGEPYQAVSPTSAPLQRPQALEPTVFLALAIALASMLGWMAFQSWVLLGERSALVQAAASQQQQVDASSKVRQQLDAVATGMQRLAASGNVNANIVVEELRKRGVTINLNPPTAGTEKK